MLNVLHIARYQIVHGNNMETFADKAVAQVGTEETGAAGDEYAFHERDKYKAAND